MDQDVEVLSPPAPFSMAEDWYQFASPTHFWFQWRFAAIQGILRKVQIGPKILEIGCGNCVARNQLEELVDGPVEGCDLNIAALRIAPRGRGRLYLYDIHDQRTEWDRFFDTIILLDTLEHIEDTAKFLTAVRYHLRPGGTLLVNVPAMHALYGRYDEAAGHVKRYSIAVLRRELHSTGFRVKEHQYWGFTLLPVLALRTFLQRTAKKENVIARGIAPSSRLADWLLRGLMWTERCILPRPRIGASLLALAENADDASA